MRYPAGFKKWEKGRRRLRWKWGDPEVLDTQMGELACYIASEGLTVLHPHLRRRAHHDLRHDAIGHEMLHHVFPAMNHARIARLERKVGQFLHDLLGCDECGHAGMRGRPK